MSKGSVLFVFYPRCLNFSGLSFVPRDPFVSYFKVLSHIHCLVCYNQTLVHFPHDAVRLGTGEHNSVRFQEN